MTKKWLIFGVLAVALVALVARLGGERPHWTLVSPPKSRFSVWMPNAPHVHEYLVGDESEQMRSIELVTTNRGAFFLVAYWDIRDRNDCIMTNVLQNFGQATVSKYPGATKFFHSINLRDAPGIELILTDPSGISLQTRSYIMENRQFSLMVGKMRDTSVEEDTIKRFFDSFQILPRN